MSASQGDAADQIFVNAYSTVRDEVPTARPRTGAWATLPNDAPVFPSGGPHRRSRSLVAPASSEDTEASAPSPSGAPESASPTGRAEPFLADTPAAHQFSEHLQGFLQYALNSGVERAGEYTPAVHAVAQHIAHTRRQYVFERPSGYTASDLAEFTEWARHANAIFLIQGEKVIRDASGRDLLDPQTPPSADGQYAPRHPAARNRRNEIRGNLWDEGIRVARSLPPVLSEYEVVLRRPQEILRQVQVLQDVPGGQGNWELAAMETLLWAVGRFDGDITSLYPTDTPEDLVAAATAAGQPHLRDLSEICDAFEYIVTLRWLAVDQEIRAAADGGTEAAGRAGAASGDELDEVQRAVLLERHRALAWMTTPGASWEDVDLST